MARQHPSHYPVEVAVSDVVQRCLEAGAEQVDVAIEFAGSRSWIRIAATTGRVIATSGVNSGAAAPTLPATPAGLDAVSACASVGASVAVESAGDGEATVMVVEGLHEVLAYKRKEGRVIETVVARMRQRVVDTLGLAFHRALAGVHRRATPIAITVNAEPVTARDPFDVGGPALALRRRELPFVIDGRVEAVMATPHVFSAADTDPAAGRQGFFVYLRDRLVQTGGWSRLSVVDRADGVARIAVDLPAPASSAFAWEAAARRVLFPASLAPALRAVAFEAVNVTYTRGRALTGGSAGTRVGDA